MLPYLPQSFHEAMSDAVRRQSLNADPDGFFPELTNGRPDPMGLWMVQRSSSAVERLQALWASFARSGKAAPAADASESHGSLVHKPGA